jgi:hypothetical protein
VAPTDRGDLQLDHVLIAVDDLPAAADVLTTRHGLASLEGGEHPDWGTANRIVPLGDSYLELVAVVDPLQAAKSSFGRWVSETRRLPRPLGWAVRTTNLDAIALRLGLATTMGSRTRPDGQFLRWRLAGVEQAAAEPSLPFFIEWDRETSLPGQALIAHSVDSAQIAELHLRGEVNRLDNWLGHRRLPVTVSPGHPEVTAVILRRASGLEITLDARL